MSYDAPFDCIKFNSLVLCMVFRESRKKMECCSFTIQGDKDIKSLVRFHLNEITSFSLERRQ